MSSPNAPTPNEGSWDAIDSERLGLTKANDYAAYLGLETLLSAQRPKSSEHDEMLFIIQHQASELWMKLILHELRASIQHIRSDQPGPGLKNLARVRQVMTILFEQWSILETMTPAEYARFRAVLGRGSGFQSSQYRKIEFLLGNKDANSLVQLRQREDENAELYADLRAPSLYDEFWRLLARRGLPVPAGRLERDFSIRYDAEEELLPVLQAVYEAPEKHWLEYEMSEKLVDLDQMFQLWRFRHMQTVERMIGYKPGTGQTRGADYLRERARVQLYPELWRVRTLIRDVEKPQGFAS